MQSLLRASGGVDHQKGRSFLSPPTYSRRIWSREKLLVEKGQDVSFGKLRAVPDRAGAYPQVHEDRRALSGRAVAGAGLDVFALRAAVLGVDLGRRSPGRSSPLRRPPR